MRYSNNLFLISVAVFGAYFAHNAIAAQNAPSAFSTYGLIQPVQKYSSNPFWNMDSPYNQRMPVPVYATGADLTSGDCNRVVENLVASYCASHDYCTDSRLSDVRPTVMVQLSQLPGHNFATSCGGYIDSAFEQYQKQYGNVSAGTVYYTTTPTVQQTNTVQYTNPLKQKQSEYQKGVAERSAELEQLQRVTTASPELEPTYFPKTTADLSFTDRLANTTAGYEPYKNLDPYRTPQFESDAEFYERLKTQNPTEYCRRFPDKCKKETSTPNQTSESNTNIEPNPVINPGTGCPDPHMDANCECTGIYAPSANPNICTCADSTKDIANNCADTIAPGTMPQCLVKMSKDNNFMQPLANLLRNSTKLDINELKTRQVYAPIAQAVHLYCVDSNNAPAQDFSEFNSWIDNHDTLPIRIPFNGRIETIDVNAEDLFNYNDYSYSVLMVYKTPYTMQSAITRDDIKFFSTDKKCVNYTNLAGAIDENYFSGTPAVRKAAKDVYGDRVYNISKSKISFFPGKLLYGSRSAGLNQVKVNNYIIARKKIVNFWKNLQSEIDCQNKDIALYLVNDAVVDPAKGTLKVIVKSEPFFIP